ncbi:hypothetical protein V2K16_00575 [Pseudomonas alliivorans]|uniref:hypothetical protein n=1 Tax=Pseudomonas alliivorans TaxID=2810613 RepID=UPI001AE2B6D0|nr:hypothetical protein [Pseudomonas alliivorans]MBP0938720.1 hypothetical protein [Pseudomonas alliivorans]MEE4878395.1 hypothetical protein [Pseudomonas alliivorans]MEE4928153.1 hypothetical protein [Pseudomonas alliivorans]MEE4933567.1 hypothetical protein [Pseudomonas alliivorans]MEE4938699.1 hypothetical protein [Pseudomonas alliivorans]
MTRLEDLQRQAHAATPVLPTCNWHEQTDVPFVIRALKDAGISLAQLSHYVAKAEQYKLKHGELAGWTAYGGGDAQSVYREHFKREQASRRQAQKELAAIGHKALYPTYRNVKDLLTEAHDRAFSTKEERPSGREILRGLHADHEVVVTFAKRIPKKHTKRALGELRGHPTSKRLERQGLRSARDLAAITGATMAGSVAELYQRADVAKRLEQQEMLTQEVAGLKARLAALEARTAASETRHEITEAGGHWHEVASQMRADGASYGAIAKATGQGRSTVSQYILRQQLAKQG